MIRKKGKETQVEVKGNTKLVYPLFKA